MPVSPSALLSFCVGPRPSEHPRQPDLARRGGSQIVAAHDERHALIEVVDDDREGVGPVAVPIANGGITLAGRGLLCDRSLQQIDERLGARFHAQAPCHPITEWQPARPARAGIPAAGALLRGDLLTRARAAVEQAPVVERRRGRGVDSLPIALTRFAAARAERRGWIPIGHEAEPVEIVEQGGLEGPSRALAVVVLDAEQHVGPESSGQAPDVDGVDDMAEVQQSGRGRREPCQGRSAHHS
jgi:hypothetical protein